MEREGWVGCVYSGPRTGARFMKGQEMRTLFIQGLLPRGSDVYMNVMPWHYYSLIVRNDAVTPSLAMEIIINVYIL